MGEERRGLSVSYKILSEIHFFLLQNKFIVLDLLGILRPVTTLRYICAMK